MAIRDSSNHSNVRNIGKIALIDLAKTSYSCFLCTLKSTTAKRANRRRRENFGDRRQANRGFVTMPVAESGLMYASIPHCLCITTAVVSNVNRTNESSRAAAFLRLSLESYRAPSA